MVSAPEKGATFTVRLPLLPVEPQDRQGSVATPQARGVQVLLVEDNSEVRRALERMLRRTGYCVTPVENGPTAIGMMSAHASFDLLLTDAVMPDTDTPGLIQQFRKRFPDKPVILASGWMPEQLARHGTLVDEDVTFLPKPVTPDRLQRALHQALEARVGTSHGAILSPTIEPIREQPHDDHEEQRHIS